MRGPMFRIMMAALLTASAVAGCRNDREMEAELERWRGNWQCLSRNEEGTRIPEEEAREITLTVGGTLYHFRWGDNFDELGRYVFHPDQDPKALDVHIESPPEMKGRVVYLIYKMEGDRLMIAHREDQKRPTDFSSEPDSGQTVEVWERIKPPPTEEAEPEDDQDDEQRE